MQKENSNNETDFWAEAAEADTQRALEKRRIEAEKKQSPDGTPPAKPEE